jgi:hypothetical protein
LQGLRAPGLNTGAHYVPTTDFKVDFRPINKGALLGSARVEHPSGAIWNDCLIFDGDHGMWASPPSRPMISPDGTVVKDSAGKTRYQPVVEFASKEARDRWSAQVLAALRLAYPELFA